MYKFVDTLPTGSTQSASLSLQTVFNGINLDDALTDEDGSFVTLTVTGRGNTSIARRTISIPNMHGAWEENEGYREPREIVVKYKMKDRTNEGIRKRFDDLKALLVGAKLVLAFTDENAIYYASLSNLEVPEEESNDLVGNITFLCSDPDKYGEEKELYFPSDIVNLFNEGTAEAEPIFELTALKNTTFAMVSNSEDEYNLIGEPADDDIEIVNTKPVILSERGETLDTWTDVGTRIDDFIGGTDSGIDGAMTYDGTGIIARSYGTGSKTHGPALIKEIPAIQDFEVDTIFDTISNFDRDNYRMEVYLFDENMTMLGKIGLNDNHMGFTRRIGLGRVGEYVNSSKRYIISGSTFKRDDLGEVALIYLRVRREGQRFTFYISEIRNGKHYVSYTGNYNDVNNEHQGKLKYIQIYIGSWQDRDRTFRTRINRVNVYELLQEAEDQTPYILFAGDVVEFNHKNNDILINGESRNDLKNFGGSFFDLKKGENTIAVTPEDSFETKVRFRDKFL